MGHMTVFPGFRRFRFLTQARPSSFVPLLEDSKGVGLLSSCTESSNDAARFWVEFHFRGCGVKVGVSVRDFSPNTP